MKQVLIWALTGLLLVASAPITAETASQVFQQVSPSIVVVLAYDPTGKPAELGSGVVLPNHDVATNCHVLKDGADYRVRYLDKDYRAQLNKTDWRRDVCSLSVPGLLAPPVVLGSTMSLQVGAQVYAVGTPEGLQLTLSEGIVSSLRQVAGGSYIQTTAAISPGSSGGGLFDDQGRLLGLTSFFASQGQQLNFALPVEWIESLPQRSTPRSAQRFNEVDWINRAIVLEQKKAWGGLSRLSKDWLEASPGDGLALLTLGEASVETGHYSQAIGALTKALQINPHPVAAFAAWNQLGLAYDDAGQYSQSLAAYRQALKLRPNDEKTWYNLGVTYGHAGENSQSIDAYRQALQIDPKFAAAWSSLGLDYVVTKQFLRAIDALHQSLQINPQDAQTWLTLRLAYDGSGLIYDSERRYPEAIDAFRRALQISPQDAHSLFFLGLAYHKDGQITKSLDTYQQLKTLSPELAKKLFDAIVPK